MTPDTDSYRRGPDVLGVMFLSAVVWAVMSGLVGLIVWSATP